MMNKVAKTIVGFLLLSLLFVFSCQQKSQELPDSIIEGKATIYVDESILPIIEDQEAVFETQYNAKLHLVAKSENEVLNAMFNDTATIAVLTRDLTKEELKVFQSKKINPKITPFATDAVALIRSKASNDSIVALQDVIDFMKGKAVGSIKGLVFDNANSSTVRYMADLSGIAVNKQKNIFSFKTNQEVIQYVATHEGMIGVIGINWIFQPPLDLQETVNQVTVLGVKGINADTFEFPTQDNLAQGNYPLARHLYFVNCQGYSGLGMGFASFIGGERGQRIILKSGLVPERVPTRKIVIRNKLTKDKN
jgi:phosphate transport system substrate-binding protein